MSDLKGECLCYANSALKIMNAPNKEDQEDTPDDVENEMEFTKVMRHATRKAHNLSDALVNAKLSIAMSDDKIWAEGLLIFYEIFRVLENALFSLSGRGEAFKKMQNVLIGIERTKAFEADLEFYYGKDFLRTYSIRPSVANYLRHLKLLEEREPLRLLAYIYHLYLGLLSGGQILKRKRDLKKKLTTFGGLIGNNGQGNDRNGDAVTEFGVDGRSISDIRKDITFTMNDIAMDLTKNEKDSLISESILVFQKNNEIIKSVKNTGKVAIVNVVCNPVFVLLVLMLSIVLFYFFS